MDLPFEVHLHCKVKKKSVGCGVYANIKGSVKKKKRGKKKKNTIVQKPSTMIQSKEIGRTKKKKKVFLAESNHRPTTKTS